MLKMRKNTIDFNALLGDVTSVPESLKDFDALITELMNEMGVDLTKPSAESDAILNEIVLFWAFYQYEELIHDILDFEDYVESLILKKPPLSVQVIEDEVQKYLAIGILQEKLTEVVEEGGV